MGKGPFSLDNGFLERKDAEFTQEAIRSMADYSDHYFNNIEPEEQKRLAALKGAQDDLITNPVGRVLTGSAADFSSGMGEFFGKLSSIANVIGQETGFKPGGLFNELKNTYLKNAVFYDRMIQKRGPTEDILMSIVGGALPGILNFTPGPLGIPFAGAAGYARAREAGEGHGAAAFSGIKDAVHRAILGKVFHAMAGSGRMGSAAERGFFENRVPGEELAVFGKNVASMATIGAADTMISSGLQASPADVAKGAVSMGVLGAMGGPKARPGSNMTPEHEAQASKDRQALAVFDKYLDEDFKKFDPAKREENANLWWGLYKQDPERWHPKTIYDTPEIILARDANKGLEQTININTPERDQLREDIVNKVYGSGAVSKTRQAYIVMGPPGSGKSSHVVDNVRDRAGAIVIDNDNVKEKLPEYGEGLYANRVHDESSAINNRIFEKAVDNGDNIVYPMIGKTIENVRELRDILTNAGYEVHLGLVELPAEKAAVRTVKRYLDKGRFVDPLYVVNAVDGHPRRSFEQLIKEGGISSHAAWDADVAKGEYFKPIEAWTSRGDGFGRVRGEASDLDAESAGRTDQGGASEKSNPVPVAVGRSTNIIHSDGQDVAKYVLVDASEIQSSHDPLKNFSLNPNYPGNETDIEGRNKMLAQERPYHLDKDLQGKVHEIANGVRPEFLVTDNPDPINGPPIVTPGLKVPGGNRRAMALRLMYENNPEQAAIYKNYLMQNADKFGLDPQAVGSMERPVLTRMLMDAAPDSDVNIFTRKVRLYNQSFTAGLQANAEYVSKGRMLSDDSLRVLADGLKDDTTLREYLNKSKSYDLFKSLINDGVIEQTKVARYFNDKTGTLTQDGKSLVEGVLRGKIIDDYDLLAAAPLSALQRIDRSIPSLAKVKGQPDGWDLTPDLKTALEAYTKFKATTFRTAEEYLSQDSLFGSDAAFMRNPQAVRLFKMLDEETPTGFADRVSGYARSADLARTVKDQGSLGFYKPLSSKDAFRKYIEGDSITPFAASPKAQYLAAERMSLDVSPKVLLADLSENIMHDLPMMEAARGVSVKGKLEQLSLIMPENDLPLFGGKADEMPTGPAPKGIKPGARTFDQLDIFDNLGKAEEALEAAPLVRTLGKKIDESLINTGEIEWNGTVVDNIHDLALAAQVYRDPRWETNRVWYAKQNENGTYTILHHAGLTQRLPDRCLAMNVGPIGPKYKPGPEAIERGVNSIATNIEKYGATHVFFSHNHPQSFGGVGPSGNDIVLNMTWADKLGDKYAGSFIIDGENFHVATPNWERARPISEAHLADLGHTSALKMQGVSKYVPMKEEWGNVKAPDKFAGQAVPHPSIGKVITNSVEFVDAVKDVATNPDYALLLIRGNKGDLTLIQEIHADLLKDIEKGRPVIQDAARHNGGDAFIYLHDEKMLDKPHLKALLNKGLVQDVIITKATRAASQMFRYDDADLYRPSGAAFGKESAREWPVYQVRAIKDAYDKDLLPDISDPESQASKTIKAAAERFLDQKIDDLDVHPDLDLNWRRIETAEDIADAVKRTVSIFESDTLKAKSYQSNEMTVKLAEDMGMSVDGLIRSNGGEAFSAKEITAMRWMHLSSAKQVLELAKQAARSTDEADAFAFRKQLAVHYAIQCQFYKYRAEAGRALNAWKITARESEAMAKEISDYVAGMGGAGQAREMAVKVMGLESPEQISVFARQAHQATTLDMVLEAWVNGLLSNPTTHAVNTIGNTAAMTWQVPERYLAAKISRFLDPQQEVFEGEATQMVYGMVQGFKDALMMSARGKDAMRKAGTQAGRLDLVNAKETLGKALEESKIAEMPLFGEGEKAGDFGPAWQALISGDTSGQFGKMELARRAITGENVKANFPRLANVLQQGGFDLGAAMDFLGETVRGPGRLLMTEDEIFKAGGYRMELHAQAFRTASKEGLTGEAFSRRVNDIIQNPPKEIKVAATDYSTYLTFTNKLNESENMISKASGKLMEMANVAPALRFIVPFIRTPINIFMFTAERTPVGLFVKSIRNDIFSGNGAERALAIARMSLGSMVMAVAYEMTMSDLITGGGPGDKELREAKVRTGWQPYSIKMGDQYVAYNRLDPFGSIVGMAADAAEVWNHLHEEGHEDKKDTLATMVVASLAKNMTNKTYLEGVSRFIDAIHNPDRYGSGWIERFVASFTPSGVAHIERLIDPTVRETQGVIDAIKARIPGLSTTLPPKRNIWGEPIQFQGALGPDSVSPFYTSRDKHSPIDDEIVRHRVDHIQTPTARQVFAGVELTPEQHSRFLEIMGQEIKTGGKNLKDTLNDMIESPHYQDLSDGPMGGKAFMLSRVVHQYREQAKHYLLNEDVDVRAKVMGLKTKKREARTGRPAGMPTL